MFFFFFFFLLTGVIFLFLENTFYQYLDEDGFLHESLFLPLGVFAVIIGSLLLVTLILKKVWLFWLKKNRNSK